MKRQPRNQADAVVRPRLAPRGGNQRRHRQEGAFIKESVEQLQMTTFVIELQEVPTTNPKFEVLLERLLEDATEAEELFR